MSLLHDAKTPGKPSLLGSGHSRITETPVNNRVLAHLEGRQNPSTNVKALGAGLLVLVLVAAGALYAWLSHTLDDGAAPSTPAAMTGAAAPAQQHIVQAPADGAAAAQPARIIQGGNASPGAAPAPGLEPTAPAPQPPALAAPAPAEPHSVARRAAPPAPAAAPARATAPAKPKSGPTKVAQSGDKAKAPAQRTQTVKPKEQPAAAAAEAEPAPDPDAELLTILLRRRVPQPEHPRK